MITKELKQKIAAAMTECREMFGGSDGQYAVSLGINGSIYNRIKNGETEKLLTDARWISLARALNVQLVDDMPWETVQTPGYLFVTKQLEFCWQNSALAVLCDDTGRGKTYTAKKYARMHKHTVYVDCPQVKTRQQFIRFIAKSPGVGHTGRYGDVYEDLVFYLRTPPLLFLTKPATWTAERSRS